MSEFSHLPLVVGGAEAAGALPTSPCTRHSIHVHSHKSQVPVTLCMKAFSGHITPHECFSYVVTQNDRE